MRKIVATIEARMTSSRLPGKVMLPVLGRPILSYLVERLQRVSSIDEIVLATTINSDDDVLVSFAKTHRIHCFRGSEQDVMGRVVGAAEMLGADDVVEITGDCPIIDPEIIAQVINTYKNNTVDYVSNTFVRSYPDGMDVQVFSWEKLFESSQMTKEPLDREHVTLHILKNPKLFSRINLVAPSSLFWPDLGLTLDEDKDFMLLSKIIEHFYPVKPFFTCGDVIKYLKDNPKLCQINEKVKRKGYA